MVKLKQIKLYETKDCPDHVIQEIDDLMNKMTNVIYPLLVESPSNYILSAFNRVHASMIVMLISKNPEEIKNAACCEAKALISNIEDISKVKIFDEEANK